MRSGRSHSRVSPFLPGLVGRRGRILVDILNAGRCPASVTLGVTLCCGYPFSYPAFFISPCSDGPCLCVLSGQGAKLILYICLSFRYLCRERTCTISQRSRHLPSLTFYFFCGWSVSLISSAVFVQPLLILLSLFIRSPVTSPFCIHAFPRVLPCP